MSRQFPIALFATIVCSLSSYITSHRALVFQNAYPFDLGDNALPKENKSPKFEDRALDGEPPSACWVLRSRTGRDGPKHRPIAGLVTSAHLCVKVWIRRDGRLGGILWSSVGQDYRGALRDGEVTAAEEKHPSENQRYAVPAHFSDR